MNNKAFFAKLDAVVILAIVYGYYGLCGYAVHVTGCTAGLDDVGRATAAILAVFTRCAG